MNCINLDPFGAWWIMYVFFIYLFILVFKKYIDFWAREREWVRELETSKRDQLLPKRSLLGIKTMTLGLFPNRELNRSPLGSWVDSQMLSHTCQPVSLNLETKVSFDNSVPCHLAIRLSLFSVSWKLEAQTCLMNFAFADPSAWNILFWLPFVSFSQHSTVPRLFLAFV